MRKKENLNRVALIGCGHVEATSAYSLLLGGTVEELVLIGKDRDRLLGELMDFQHSVPLERPVRIWAGDYEDARTADMAVIAAGVGSRPEETRLGLLGRNVAVIREIMRELKAIDFDGIVLVTTNPVEVLAQIAQEESGLAVEKVIGSGMVLDTARLKAMLGEHFGIEASSGHADNAFEHGDSEITTWCAARVLDVPLVDFCTPDCPDFDKMLERARKAAPVLIRQKGYTSFAVGSCVTKICEAVLRDERCVLPVSTMTGGQYGISGVYLNLPCVVGRGGVERIIENPLGTGERRDLLDLADLLKKVLDEVKNKAALSARN